MEMEHSVKDKIVYLDGSEKKYSDMGRSSKERMGGTWVLLSLQTRF